MKMLIDSKYEVKNKSKKWINAALFAALMCVWTLLFAGNDGTDLLAGTEKDILKTILGTGKKYLFIGELVIAGITFVMTRSVKSFLGVIILFAGIDAILMLGKLV